MHPVFVKLYKQYQEAKTGLCYKTFAFAGESANSLAQLDEIFRINQAVFDGSDNCFVVRDHQRHKIIEKQILRVTNTDGFKWFSAAYNLKFELGFLNSTYVKSWFMLMEIEQDFLTEHYNYIADQDSTDIDGLYNAMQFIRNQTELTHPLCSVLFTTGFNKLQLWHNLSSSIVELFKVEYLNKSSLNLIKRLNFIGKFVTADRDYTVFVNAVLKLHNAHSGADYEDNEIKVIPHIDGDWNEFVTAWCYLHVNSHIQVNAASRAQTIAFLNHKTNEDQFDHVNIAILLHHLRNHLPTSELYKLIEQPVRQPLIDALLAILQKSQPETTPKASRITIHSFVDAVIANPVEAKYFAGALKVILLCCKKPGNDQAWLNKKSDIVCQALIQPGVLDLIQGLSLIHAGFNDGQDACMRYMHLAPKHRAALLIYLEFMSAHNFLKQDLFATLMSSTDLEIDLNDNLILKNSWSIICQVMPEKNQQQACHKWFELTSFERKDIWLYMQRFMQYDLLNSKLFKKLYDYREVIKSPTDPREFLVLSDILDDIVSYDFYDALKTLILSFEDSDLKEYRCVLNKFLCEFVIPNPTKLKKRIDEESSDILTECTQGVENEPAVVVLPPKQMKSYPLTIPLPKGREYSYRIFVPQALAVEEDRTIDHPLKF